MLEILSPVSLSGGMWSIFQTSFSTSGLSCHLFLSLFCFSHFSSSPCSPLYHSQTSLLFLGFLSVHNPKVQVHSGRYNPAERYSPPLRPHLSLSAPLPSTPSSASVWSLLVLGDKLLPSCLRLSLYVSVLFASSLLCHTLPGLHGCCVVALWLQATPTVMVFPNQQPVWRLNVSISGRALLVAWWKWANVKVICYLWFSALCQLIP